jgi:hypothetical protein
MFSLLQRLTWLHFGHRCLCPERIAAWNVRTSPIPIPDSNEWPQCAHLMLTVLIFCSGVTPEVLRRKACEFATPSLLQIDPGSQAMPLGWAHEASPIRDYALPPASARGTLAKW